MRCQGTQCNVVPLDQGRRITQFREVLGNGVINVEIASQQDSVGDDL